MLNGEFMANFLLHVLCNYKIARVDLMLFFQENSGAYLTSTLKHILLFILLLLYVYKLFLFIPAKFSSSLTSLEMQYISDKGYKLASSTIQ